MYVPQNTCGKFIRRVSGVGCVLCEYHALTKIIGHTHTHIRWQVNFVVHESTWCIWETSRIRRLDDSGILKSAILIISACRIWECLYTLLLSQSMWYVRSVIESMDTFSGQFAWPDLFDVCWTLNCMFFSLWGGGGGGPLRSLEDTKRLIFSPQS